MSTLVPTGVPGTEAPSTDDDGFPAWVIIAAVVGLLFCCSLLVLFSVGCCSKGKSSDSENKESAAGPPISVPLLEPHDGTAATFDMNGQITSEYKRDSSALPVPPATPLLSKDGKLLPTPLDHREAASETSQATTVPNVANTVDELLKSRAAADPSTYDRKLMMFKNAQRIGGRDGVDIDFHSLAPDYGFAVRGEWKSSTGLRIEVSRDGTVYGGDGSSAQLLETNTRALAMRSGQHFTMLSDGKLLGPAPELLRWDDGTMWVRERNDGRSPRREPGMPQGLAAGTRVDTPQGRGTLVRRHNGEASDKLQYWYVRLDADPTVETVVPAQAARILPWFQQDAVLQEEVAPATQKGFQQFTAGQMYHHIERDREAHTAALTPAKTLTPARGNSVPHVYSPPRVQETMIEV